MGVWERIKYVFTNESNTASEGVVDTTWKPCSDTTMWQLKYAQSVVANVMATFFINVRWKTYIKGKPTNESEWLRLNYKPNRKETAAEFYSKLANKFVYDGKALIIETATREFFIADSYQFKNGEELLMKDNTFVDVKIGNVTLNRSFKENDSCLYIKTPHYEDVKNLFQSMGADYAMLKEMVYEGAQKALGMKLVLEMEAQNKNSFDEKALKNLQKRYEPLMKQRDAVFLTFKGEKIQDLTERQRGSEVQQVLEAVDNNIKINHEILCSVGACYGIPQKFLLGDFIAENNSIFEMAVTMFAKPYLTLLSQKFTLFMLTDETILQGGKIIADLDSIKFINALEMSNAIDKLIGSGAYNINEVREMLNDDPVEGGDTRFITKNYAVLSQYIKGDTT